METSYDDCCFLFLSKIGLRYKTFVFNPNNFDNKISSEEFNNVMKKIYEKTGQFMYLGKYLRQKRRNSWLGCFLISNFLTFMLFVATAFSPIFFAFFVIWCCISLGICLGFIGLENYFLKKSRMYEETVINVLKEENEKFRERGIKFSCIRYYYVIVLHAEYKRKNKKYQLAQGIPYDPAKELRELQKKRRELIAAAQRRRMPTELDMYRREGSFNRNRRENQQRRRSLNAVNPPPGEIVDAIQNEATELIGREIREQEIEGGGQRQNGYLNILGNVNRFRLGRNQQDHSDVVFIEVDDKIEL